MPETPRRRPEAKKSGVRGIGVERVVAEFSRQHRSRSTSDCWRCPCLFGWPIRLMRSFSLCRRILPTGENWCAERVSDVFRYRAFRQGKHRSCVFYLLSMRRCSSSVALVQAHAATLASAVFGKVIEGGRAPRLQDCAGPRSCAVVDRNRPGEGRLCRYGANRYRGAPTGQAIILNANDISFARATVDGVESKVEIDRRNQTAKVTPPRRWMSAVIRWRSNIPERS